MAEKEVYKSHYKMLKTQTSYANFIAEVKAVADLQLDVNDPSSTKNA